MAAQVTPAPFTPGFQLIDGTALSAAMSQGAESSQNAITASTTQTRVGGTAITAQVNRVSVASASDAVTLLGAGKAALAGTIFWIKNTSGQTIQVFPPGANDTIDGGSAGAAVNLGTAKIGMYMCVAVVGGLATWASGSMAVST